MTLLVGLHILPGRIGELASRTRTWRGVLIVYRLACQVRNNILSYPGAVSQALAGWA